MIGFLGGTGPEGRGLALRFALAGQEVFIGSRDQARAEAAATDVRSRFPRARVAGVENAQAAARSDIVFLTVPSLAHSETLALTRDLLKGKVLVDVVAPIIFAQRRARAVPPPEGSMAQQAQRLIPDARVVGAFHNVSAEDLLIPDRSIDCDVVVCSDDQKAKKAVMRLAETIRGVRAVDGDGLENSRYVEELTALLLNINRIYKGRSMIKIVGI